MESRPIIAHVIETSCREENGRDEVVSRGHNDTKYVSNYLRYSCNLTVETERPRLATGTSPIDRDAKDPVRMLIVE